MTAARTSRARRTSGPALVIALLVVLMMVAAGVVIGITMVGDARDKGFLGGPVVVPDEYRTILRKAAKRCEGVSLEVLAAQIAAESGWDPQAKSGAGAQGIAQFMPEVWKQYGIDANDDGKADVWDPVDAIHSAAELNCLNRRLVKEASGNRLENVLAAYNAGFSSVLKYDGIPPFPETQAYVTKILDSAKTIVVK